MQPCPAADSPAGSSHTRWLAHTTIPDTPPASLHPHYRASSLLPGSPPLCAASVLYLLPFRQLEDLPSKTGRVSRGRSSPMAGRAPRGQPSSSARQPSRPGESHPQPLTEPGVPLSKYPARGIHAAVPGCGQTLRALPTQGGWPNWAALDTPPPWLHSHYRASQLLRGGPPLCSAFGTLPLAGPQLEDLPSWSGE